MAQDELLARYPGRVIYPSFNPDRPQEPWDPIKENREFWKRTQPRQAAFRTVQKGWPTDPVRTGPVCRCSRCRQRRATFLDGTVVNHFPDKDRHDYLMHLQRSLPERTLRGYGW